MAKVEEFFARYEEAANSFDPDLTSSLYTAEFMAGDPNGVSCGRLRRDSIRALGLQ